MYNIRKIIGSFLGCLGAHLFYSSRKISPGKNVGFSISLDPTTGGVRLEMVTGGGYAIYEELDRGQAYRLAIGILDLQREQ